METKKIKEEPVKEEPIKEEKAKPLVEQMKELKDFKREVISGNIKTKKMNIPRGAKVRKRSLKQGWIGVLKIDENRNISGEKQKMAGSAYMTKDGYYHASDGRELFFWQGKFPVVIQPSWKTNPLMIDPKSETNETYGDKYKMAKMLADTIKVKSKGGNIIIWVLIAGAAIYGINYLSGGSIFG